MINLEVSTKAKTLAYLEKYQIPLKFKIPKSYYFTKNQYKKNKDLILKKIIKIFGKKRLIVRSSSLSEDQKNKSMAGKFDSYHDVLNCKETLDTYINLVLKKFKNKNDQVLIQEYISDVDIAGVVFTRNLNNNGPYYYINYDTSGKTNFITGGIYFEETKNEVISRFNFKKKTKFKKLIEICRSIEKIFSNDRLDIEFCIKNNKILIFQCRTLSSMKKIDDESIFSMLVNIENKIKKIKLKSPFLKGKTTYLSNMADWNPAEMIGSKSTPLALSLYSELITNDIWSKQREDYQYQTVSDHPLLFNLGGSAYVDLRLDINSFLPKNIPNFIKKKIVDHCLSKIKKNPSLHDKIEFDVIETCYDLETKKNIKKYLNNNQVNIYLNALKQLTNGIICNNYLEKEEKKIQYLKNRLKLIKTSNLSHLQKIYFLVQNCKKYGTLPFAGAARCAFVATKILRTLVKSKILDVDDIENFYSSTKSITTEMNNLLYKLRFKKIKKSYFFEKFGHLRPSTYSISSKNYQEEFHKYFPKGIKLNFKSNKKFFLKKDKILKINKLFKKNEMKFDSKNFFEFSKKAIYYREEFKLIFTKCINDIFVNLILFGKELGIQRENLEYISINTILNSYNNLDLKKFKIILKEEIKNNKKNFNSLKLIDLPDVILDSSNIYNFEKKNSLPNYITERSITAKSINFKNLKDNRNLKGKIVILESADPGYDFIFSFDIKGLITKYGGANSHMSIRCLELGVPAIIGVGEIRYKKLAKAKIININSQERNYKIIN